MVHLILLRIVYEVKLLEEVIFFLCLVLLLDDEEDLKCSCVLRFILNVDMVRLESVADNVILGVR